MGQGKAESTYDLVVVGMGAAGLAAAVAYADEARSAGQSPRVAVLERSSEAERGGATRYTSSWFRVTEDRRLDPNFVGLMESVSGGMADLDYCRTLAAEVGETLSFLESHEVEVIYFKQPFPNRNTGGGLGMPAGGGIAIVDGLGGVADRTDGIAMLYETEAVRLRVCEEGRVDGVVTRGRDGLLRTLAARAVVIASGGFEGNKEMLTQYLGPRACDMPVIAPGPGMNRGDGIRMAMEIGADTAGQFDMFHGEPVDPRATKPDAVVYPYPYGIVVNGEAKRFFDEGMNSFDSTFEALAFAIWRDQDQRAFLVADQTMLGIDHVGDVNFTDQPPVTAATLAELASGLGLDPDTLEETVAEYNAAVQPGEFDPYSFDGKRTSGITPPKSNWAYRLESPPYVGWPLTCAITFTFGGVRTDSSARVVSPAGTAIPGLYAAGEVTGLYYHEYPVGTSVLRALTFGRIAGAHAARAAAASPAALAGSPG